jgi:hypothetical protein
VTGRNPYFSSTASAVTSCSGRSSRRACKKRKRATQGPPVALTLGTDGGCGAHAHRYDPTIVSGPALELPRLRGLYLAGGSVLVPAQRSQTNLCSPKRTRTLLVRSGGSCSADRAMSQESNTARVRPQPVRSKCRQKETHVRISSGQRPRNSLGYPLFAAFYAAGIPATSGKTVKLSLGSPTAGDIRSPP